MVIVGSKKLSKKIPGALIAVVGAIAASWAFKLGDHVHVLGAVPSGLPHLGLPEVKWSWELVGKLVPTAFAMFVVILAQSAATSRAYAARYNERFSENTDLVGLGLANIGAGLSGTFVVNGSPTKTQMVDSAGGRSQLSLLYHRRYRIAGVAVSDRAVGLHAGGGVIGSGVPDRCRPDRHQGHAEASSPSGARNSGWH